MNNQIIRFLAMMLGMTMIIHINIYSQESITIVVKDEGGNPITGAMVIVGEDGNPVYTNDRGEFLVPSGIDPPVYFEAKGFESKLIRLSGMRVVVLEKMPYQLGERDNVHVPFGIMKKRQIPSAITVFDPKDILGYDEVKSVNGVLQGRAIGIFGSTNIRGCGSALMLINGVPRQAVDINPHEIDQITVVNDLYSAMLYGTQAKNSIILITTRRGSALKKELNFTAESGIHLPVLYPKYLSGADYMELYNEALENDDLDPKYSQTQIDSTRSGLNPVRFPDEDYYSSKYLRDFFSYRNFIAEVIRGNQTGKFTLNVGWNHSDGLLKIGEGANEDHNRLSLRSNIDFRVSDIIDLVFDASIVFNIDRTPRYTGNDFWNLSTTYQPNLFPVLIPASLLSDAGMLEAAKLINEKYVLGGTTEYLTNLYGDLYFNGSRRFSDRLVEINTGLIFDLSSITQGLKAKAHLIFDMYNSFYDDMLNSYAVYRPNYSGNSLTSFTKLGFDVRPFIRNITEAYYNRRYGVYGTLDYRRQFGEHEVTATALGFLNEYNQQAVRQPLKYGHLGLRANYMYHNKYIAEITGVYAISGKLLNTQNPYSFSPGLGLGWIITEENFFAGNSFINFMKLRANWALLNTDENLNDYNLGKNYYVSSGSYPYNDGGYTNNGRILYAGNTNINWEKVSNINIGLEAELLDYKLCLETSYFYNKNFDIITRRANSLPDFFGNLPYENHGSNQLKGIELGVSYFAKVGDLEMRVGSNFVYSVPKLLSTDELKYLDEYRRTVGKPTDARFAYVALGLFKDQNEIDNHAFQTFGSVKPGDIKYKDLNNDGLIDENDQMMIGNSSARVNYGLHLRLKYKATELFALGTGQTGQDSYFTSSYYWVYGDRKYSEVVLDRWTPATAENATYPRLSSSSNPNNFRNSTFWLYKNNWFKLHTLQLTHTLNKINFIGLNEVRLFARGSNLIKFSRIKDKTNLTVGSSPQLRTFSLGANMKF